MHLSNIYYAVRNICEDIGNHIEILTKIQKLHLITE